MEGRCGGIGRSRGTGNDNQDTLNEKIIYFNRRGWWISPKEKTIFFKILWCFLPIISATWEAEDRKLQDQGQPELQSEFQT